MAAQEGSQSPREALNTVFEKGNLLAALSGHEWRPGLNLAAAQLSVGQSISLNVTLIKDVEYVFLASGPTEQADVDLYLRDSSGRVLAEDKEEDGTPVVEFIPETNGTYQLQLHLAAGASPEDFVALSLLRKGGRQVSELEYRSTSSGFFAAAKKLTSQGDGCHWQKKTGEWCLFGYSLQEKSGISLGGLRLSPGKAFFAAAGPEPSEIALYLANEAGQFVAKTKRPQTFPLLHYDAPSGTTLDLRVEVGRSKSHILVLVGAFEQ